MLDTALVAVDPISEPPVDRKDPNATRPVRMLVPTTRRGNMFLSENDTLLASDLGSSRHTTDAELAEMWTEFDGRDHETLFPGLRADEIPGQMLRMRDGLAHPRDIAEAREWGLYVPRTLHENWQEFLDGTKINERLGWWFVYDLDRKETHEQRRDRYLRDRRLIDTKGMARVQCRSYPTMKSLKAHTDGARMSLDNPASLNGLIETFTSTNPDMTADEACEILITEAQKLVLKGTPRAVDSAGQSDLFLVADCFENGNSTTRLDEWFHYRKIPQTGRPPGSRNRRPKVSA
jgi:hypothetical protein